MLDARPSLHEQYTVLDREHEYEARDYAAAIAFSPKRTIPETNRTAQIPVDIDWVPSFEKYQARVQRRLQHRQPSTELPDGFPLSVDYEACWTGDDFQGEHNDDFVHVLTGEQIAEVEAALAHFKGVLMVQSCFIYPAKRGEERRSN
jgi:hypothetical protein